MRLEVISDELKELIAQKRRFAELKENYYKPSSCNLEFLDDFALELAEGLTAVFTITNTAGQLFRHITFHYNSFACLPTIPVLIEVLLLYGFESRDYHDGFFFESDTLTIFDHLIEETLELA